MTNGCCARDDSDSELFPARPTRLQRGLSSPERVLVCHHHLHRIHGPLCPSSPVVWPHAAILPIPPPLVSLPCMPSRRPSDVGHAFPSLVAPSPHGNTPSRYPDRRFCKGGTSPPRAHPACVVLVLLIPCPHVLRRAHARLNHRSKVRLTGLFVISNVPQLFLDALLQLPDGRTAPSMAPHDV